MSYVRATRAIVQPRSVTGLLNAMPGIEGMTSENRSRSGSIMSRKSTKEPG